MNKRVLDRAVTAVKCTDIGKYSQAVTDLSREDIENLFIDFEPIIKSVAKEFVNLKKDISLPRIGVLAINKNKLDYLTVRQSIVEELGFDNYNELDAVTRERVDLIMKDLAREITITNSKKHQTEIANNLRNSLKL